MLDIENYLILDTETTGIGNKDEVIELGIINMDGQTVYHSLFKPNCPIHEKAAAVHGITLSEVQDAPQFSEEWHNIKDVLKGKKILIYNASFDTRMLNQTARIHSCKNILTKQGTHCVMTGYAKHHGQINPKTGQFRWIKLEQALKNEGISIVQSHRAIGDCLMTLSLIKKVGPIW
ncbi:MAG: 3'-5' exonuclease [Defluviitaleaceae bacterium]|nr:3'-5' exonuclease [Defluviitaleaceae bacterium]